jgi:hypothetical protein
MVSPQSFQDGFAIDHKGDKGDPDPDSDSDGAFGFPLVVRKSNEGDPNSDSDSDGVFGFPVAVRKSQVPRKKELVKKGVANIHSFFQPSAKRAHEEKNYVDIGDESNIRWAPLNDDGPGQYAWWRWLDMGGSGGGGIEDSMASILANVADDGCVEDDIVVIADIMVAGAEYKPKYHISNKIGYTKRVSSVCDFFEGLCATQHTKVKKHNNLKIWLACRRKEKNNLISMGGGHMNTSTIAKLINHTQLTLTKRWNAKPRRASWK